MAFELSLGGLGIHLAKADALARIEQLIPFDYLRQTCPVPDWPGRNLGAIGFPKWPARPRLRIGDFWYPTGASRWAELHIVATKTDVVALRGLCYGLNTTTESGDNPVSLVMRGDLLGDQFAEANPVVATSLYMLPPRHLFQIDAGLDDYYLITLVDERYFQFARPCGSFHPGSELLNDVSTWEDVLSALATNCGFNTFTIDAEVDPDVYGYPELDSGLWQNYENACFMLDWAAWNVGKVVVRNLDGSYKAVTFGTDIDSRYFFRTAGGTLMGATDQNNDEAVLPSGAFVTFPTYIHAAGFYDPRNAVPHYQDPYPQVYQVRVNLSDLDQPYSNFTGHPGTKFFHDTAKAYFDLPEDTLGNDPINVDELNDLAARIFADYCSAQIASNALDEVYPGIRNFPPDHFHDILWTYRLEQRMVTTRVQRKPWNFGITEFAHHFIPSFGLVEGPNCSPCIEVVELLSGPDPDNYDRYDARVKRWDSNTQEWSDWLSVWAIDANS